MALIMLAQDAVRPLLTLLLLPALGLAFWETRERKLDARWTVWWLLIVVMTHVVGYLLMRLIGGRLADSFDRGDA